MIIIQSPTTRDEFKAYYDLRYRVLREPWGQPRGTEKDDYEPLSQHFMAVREDTREIVGVVKLFEKEPGVGWFSHLAVAPAYQKKGIGKMLVAHVEEEARKRGFCVLGCYARLNTTNYFEKLGYRIAGLPTHYFGTTQVVWMQKDLEQPEERA
ncbi:GNAT family N-acetyltransferase [Anaerolinea thermophila]|uniref:Acetyltransferase n=1 Tax=Anaerolinea thermophila (strain DSM 14523 / JCM 11388 / NBRC 100420 / UNI-1) TaxID=926569 RepID=E8N2R4_ANATU|nr:GNAT family N-acetyltransferase [Anaerolinea thermophila]BAJ65064.1 putative acetyltransferase [Anaerolinea thermophila UNI-1]